MEILSISQKCLRYVGLGHEQDIPIAGKRVPRTLVRCIIIGGQFLFAAMFAAVVKCEWKRGVFAIVFPLHMSVLVLMKLSIYVVLIAKTDAIADLIEYLQDIVGRRKFIAKAPSSGEKFC